MYAYDYSHIKERLHKEMECIAGCEHWKPEHACVMKELLDSARYIEEIEAMERNEKEWMWKKEQPTHETSDMSAESMNATGVVIKKG